MPTITRFEDVEAWQTARELTRLVYTLSKEGAFARDFGLRDQMRRACVSILSNIAEGFESRTQALFIEFLGRAKVQRASYVPRRMWRWMQAILIALASMNYLTVWTNAADKSVGLLRISNHSPIADV